MADARIAITAVDQTAGAFNSANARLLALNQQAGLLATRFSGLAAAFTTALGASGVASFVTGIAAGLDKLNDLKDATGASIGNISALEDVAARTGTRFETVGAALTKLNQALQNAKPGDDTSRVLESIGLQAKALRDIDPAEALLKVAQGLAAFDDDGKKARATYVLFGRSLGEVAPLLNDLAEKGRLVATATEDQTKAAEKFNQQLSTLSKNSTDAGRALAGELLPALNKFLERLNGNSKAGGFFSSLGEELKANMASDRLRVVTAEIEGLQKAIDRQGGDAFLTKRMAALREEAAVLSREATAASEALKRFAGISDPLGSYADSLRKIEDRGFRPDIKKPSLEVPDAKVISAFDQYVKRLEDAQIASLDLSNEEQARLDITLGKLGKLTDKQQEYVVALARGLDLSKQSDPDAAARDKATADSRQSVLDTLALAAQSTAGQFEDLSIRIDAVTGQFARQEIGPLDYARAMEVLNKRLDSLVPKLEKVGESVDEFSRQAARNIQDALGESVVQVLDGKFNRIGDLWKDLLKRLVAQAASVELGRALFGDFAKTGQIGGGFGAFQAALSALFGNGGGMNYAGQFDGFRANGGPVSAGGAYIVGERGPELIVPKNDGMVLPNGATFAPAGFSVTNIIQGDASENTLRLINTALAQFSAMQMRRV